MLAFCYLSKAECCANLARKQLELRHDGQLWHVAANTARSENNGELLI